jgi:alkanesulfonate monooxygenase SsuD/methylene tetrahydromethanopterin reductase-like flavin-dependent oxidoreductase (luciferase family)
VVLVVLSSIWPAPPGRRLCQTDPSTKACPDQAAGRTIGSRTIRTGCFVSTGRSLDQAVDRVKLAESLGYDSAFVTHIAGRESLTVVTAYALGTERIRVGTGVVPIYTRTPVTMAQTAATIDELSGGRLSLGLGVSHRAVVEGWHGQTMTTRWP